MKAVYLERQGEITIRDYTEEKVLGPKDVEIAVKAVGICGSDVHYYTHGHIGDFVVKEPMILGHEAAGVVKRLGSEVTGLKVGDRVCMEPGVPDFTSKASLRGFYNLDPSLTFWATPPIHGCLRESVIHPAAFTFKLPENVLLEEGAMVEPLAIGMQAAMKARFKPGDIALVTGAGTIGIMCALAALAGGCSKVIITDVLDSKLAVAKRFEGIVAVNTTTTDLKAVLAEATDGWGADVVIEASGFDGVYPEIFQYCCPGGRFVMVGIPAAPVAINVSWLQAKEITVETVFRYANVYKRAIDLIASGKINLRQLIGKTFPFAQAKQAFEYVAKGGQGEIKVQILL